MDHDPVEPAAESWDVVVIGAGAAGLMAAAQAAARGRRTLLLEKNTKPGVKILMSGGTRCNLTHDTDRAGIIAAYGKPGRFLHSPLAALGPRELVAWFHAAGVPTKIESTGKVFPVSDKALDVLNALLAAVQTSGAELRLRTPVRHITRQDAGFLVTTDEGALSAPHVLVTVGGQSFPGCGTTGDGYAWAAALGHTIIPPRPALTPLTSPAAWVHELSGVTLPDVRVQVVEPGVERGGDRPAVVLAERRTSLLFTHFGCSGPAAMDVSRAVTAHSRPHELLLRCDLLPDVRLDALEQQLRTAAESAGKRHVASLLPDEIPHRLAATILAQLGVPPERKAAELSKTDRRQLALAVKQLDIPLAGTRGFAKAEVTAGGVALSEIDSRTMQSKLVPGLFFAGEILDLDGPIGGYNFQAAFSTGYLAGQYV